MPDVRPRHPTFMRIASLLALLCCGPLIAATPARPPRPLTPLAELVGCHVSRPPEHLPYREAPSLAGIVQERLPSSSGPTSASPFPGVRVWARETRGGAISSVTSDSSGRFAFPSLLAGTYDIVFCVPGFRTAHMVVTVRAETSTLETVVDPARPAPSPTPILVVLSLSQ